MRIRIALIICSVIGSVSLVRANEMEQAFEQVKQSFELRQKSAQNDLKQYLQDYPYTTYESDVQCMIGVLQTERGKYKNAVKTFQRVEIKHLTREQQPMFLFYRGYAFLQQGDTKKAASCFKTLRESNNPYSAQGGYYYAYCWYKEGNYERALPEFLALEHTPQYKNIVPYYIVQIYYAQHNYDEVYDRIRYLLEHNPENPNNAELHRMLGEIYYAKGSYEVAVTNFKEYEHLKAGDKNHHMLRENLYMIGLSQYRLEQYQDAISYFKRIKQQQDTLSESTCLHLGHAYVRIGDKEKAKLSYAAAMRFGMTPSVREEAMYNYALATYESGTALGESIKAFEDFLAAYPATQHAEQVYELMADMYMSSKNYIAAYESIGKISSPSPKLQETSQYLRYQIGADKFAQKKMAECCQWMRDVIAKSTAASEYKTEAYFYCAEAEYQLQDYAACLKDLKAFAAQPNANQSKNQTASLYLAGYTQLALKHYDEAVKELSQFAIVADKKQPSYNDALNRIGDCHFNKRNFAQAVEAYDKVIANGKFGVDYALFQSGYAYGLMHRYDDKIAAMSQLSTKYTKSDYADDALYELARVLVQVNRNEEAIDRYSNLLTTYPSSPLAPKAALERAMIYRNIGQNTAAIDAFKQTIELFPGSQEAYAALESMEQVYVEDNNVTSYLDYTRQLGKMNMTISDSEDSLTYAAAELQYAMGNYSAAAAGLGTYISQFCSGGRYCASALYYAADANYRLKQYNEAKTLYSQLSEIQGNPYREDTYTRLAELCYEAKEYGPARDAFRQLYDLGGQDKARTTALLGILRCSYYLQDTATLIDAATSLIETDKMSEDIVEEARYNRGKVYFAQQYYVKAIEDLTSISQNVKIQTGAEAKYLIAESYYRLGELDMAEAEIMSFSGMKTPHQYWLARSFILLADINVDKGEAFQAKQYLLALQQNYKGEGDEIATLIEERLNALNEQEQPEIIEEEEETL